ncbi:hypothetical protein BGW80DRAFT_137705 [Lactifluus volemus]|nr:hypothetical protein BGW80DRAFT_137705 [Lactifluus volemus]
MDDDSEATTLFNVVFSRHSPLLPTSPALPKSVYEGLGAFSYLLNMHTSGPSSDVRRASGSPSGSEPPPRQRRKPGRIPVSCAECRRLKLKCDQKFPCAKCVKRGCAAICPNGTLARGRTGHGVSSANNEQLNAQIEHMRRRIRELEQGLSEVYATVSNETHPLLVEEHRMPSSAPSSNTPITATPSPMHPDPSVHEADVINSFGTLSIGKKGDSCFYGATAREEVVSLPEHSPKF